MLDHDMKAFLTLLPAVAVIALMVFNDHKVVRYAAVASVLIMACFVFPVAPHRIAELLHGSPQSEQWRQGARDTRDAVYEVLPPLASAFIALGLLALIPRRVDNLNIDPNGPANGSSETNRTSSAAGSHH